jgi:hypothetical protein
VFDNWAIFLQEHNLQINQAGHYPAEAIEVMRKIHKALYPVVEGLLEQAVANNQIADTFLQKLMAQLKPLLEGVRDNRGCVSKYVWQRVQKKVEKYWKPLKKQGQKFPSIRSTARAINENAGTIAKAIKYSRSLTQACR